MAENPVQAPQAADAAVVDDGFDTPEDRAAFAEMEKADGDAEPAPDPAPADAAPKPDAGAAPAAAAAAPDADDDGEDDGDDEAAPAAGASGAAPADGQPPKPKKRVSARKYERTAAELAAAKAETATLREGQARLDERMRILNEALTPKAAPAKAAGEEDPEPDAEKDVFAWIEWNKRERGRMNERLTELQNGRQADNEDTQLATTYADDARSFAAQEPNFVPAYKFLMANRKLELAEYYFGKDLTVEGTQLTQQELAKIKGTIGAEEKQLATEAIKVGQSPAGRIFKLAKARGYRPQAPAAAADPAAAAAAKPAANGKGAPGSLADPAPAAPAAAAPLVADEIANIRRGAAASKSLSDAGGAPPNSLTPEKLANMPQEEFEAMVENMTQAQQEQMFGV